MSVERLMRCVVSFRTSAGGTDCREVLLRGNTPQSHWSEAARAALYRQHDIGGAVITNIRICSDDDRSQDFNVREPEVASLGGAA